MTTEVSIKEELVGKIVRVQHKRYPWRKAKILGQYRRFVLVRYLAEGKEPLGTYRECFPNEEMGKVGQ